MGKNCICNDLELKKSVTCFNCKKEWEEPFESDVERLQKCPKHKLKGPAGCNVGGRAPDLCEKCVNDGYEIHQISHGVCSEYEVFKK